MSVDVEKGGSGTPSRTTPCCLPLLGLLAIAAGCSSPELGGGLKWRCEDSSDCGSGYLCDSTAGHCVRALVNRDGVFDDRILFGLSASLSQGSPLADLGNSISAGIEACFAHFNSLGGIHGRKLELVTKDDAYNPVITRENVNEFLGGDNRQVFALIGVMGTAPALEALKIVNKKKILFFTPASGFDAFEPDPPHRYVFNVRPRYSQEAAQLTEYMLKTAGVPNKNIAVFGQGKDDQGQLDPFGASGLAGVAGVLKDVGIKEQKIAVTSYSVTQSANVKNAVASLLRWAASSDRHKGDGDRIRVGVVSVAIAEAAVPFIHELEDQLAAVRRGSSPASKYGTFSDNELDTLAKVDLQLTSLSTLDARVSSALKSLGTYKTKDELGKEVSRGYGRGLIIAIPVPHFDSNATGVIQYRQHMQDHKPNATLGFISLEAYIYTRILVEGLRQAGPDLTTEALIDTFENGKDGSGFQVDFGIGTVFRFDKNNHQASQKLWGMQLSDAIAFESIGVLVE